jgi:hypothetical protein
MSISKDYRDLVADRGEDFYILWLEGNFAAVHGVCPWCAADLPKHNAVLAFLGLVKDKCSCGWAAKHQRRWYWPE